MSSVNIVEVLTLSLFTCRTCPENINKWRVNVITSYHHFNVISKCRYAITWAVNELHICLSFRSSVVFGQNPLLLLDERTNGFCPITLSRTIWKMSFDRKCSHWRTGKWVLSDNEWRTDGQGYFVFLFFLFCVRW